MQNLLIEQKGPSGLLKTWRLRAEQGSLTFGQSKHADLRTPIENIKGIQGLFEFREGKWYYINLDLHSQHQQMQNGISEICLAEPTEVSLGVSQLVITPFDSRSQIFSSLEGGDYSVAKTGTFPHQLYAVYQDGVLLETKVLKLNKTFKTKFDISATAISAVQGDKWHKTQLGNVEILQRTIYLDSVEALQNLTKDQVVDEGGRKTLIVTLAAAALMALLFILSPASEPMIATATARPVEYREVSMPPMKPKKAAKAAEAPKATEQQSAVAAANPEASKQTATDGGGSKSSSMIKSLATSRLTQLIGKISAGAAKSANVIVTSGAPAGSVPTGQALAAVGAISKSGKDWSAEGAASGAGIRVSTNGKAGGQGTAGMGTLGAGNTGAGGVGLLEEEGEITGGLDREVIAQYIKSQLGQILYCYERQLSANPDLYGKVSVKFTIDGTGGIEMQKIGETTLKNATVEGCILQKVAKWKFPTPEGGTKVVVTYPFLFKSTN